MRATRIWMNRLLAVSLLSGALVGRASAEVGVVTIDGEMVPAALFSGYVEPTRPEGCAPISDSRRRDAVVSNRLFVREGQRMGIVLNQSYHSSIDKAAEDIHQLDDDAPEDLRNQLGWTLANLRAEGYRRALIGDVERTAFERC